MRKTPLAETGFPVRTSFFTIPGPWNAHILATGSSVTNSDANSYTLTQENVAAELIVARRFLYADEWSQCKDRARCRESFESLTMQIRQTVVLLVEENAAVREALEQALEREEFCVLPASDGDALSEQQPYDLALIDVNNRRRKSFETFRKLNQSKPRLPIILISSQPELLNHPAAARAAARMLKPLEIPLLCRTVRDLTVGPTGSRILDPASNA